MRKVLEEEVLQAHREHQERNWEGVLGYPFCALSIVHRPSAGAPGPGMQIPVGLWAGASFIRRIKGTCRSLSFHVQSHSFKVMREGP